MILVPASLNKQFLPILEDRATDVGALRQVFVENLTTRAEEESDSLKKALQHPELFRKWVRGLSPRESFRISPEGVPFLGGLPDSTEDIMSFLVDGGFEPMQLKFLQDLVFQTQKRRGDAMKDELHIKIPKSTYAYMLVDFQGILQPNEVHLCFSSKFDDGTNELSDLDGIDVLVGRCPAHLPSDIQKVRATFKPELRHIRDVIVFSSKGDVPLAAKLSGGDYDGDKAWVTWLPELVSNFQNADVPPKPDFSPYIEKDKDTLGDLRRLCGEEHYVDAMMAKAIRFSLRPKFLGPCTSFKDKLSYQLNSLSDERIVKLSWLLSELADQPKQGILFGRDEWRRFRDDVVGTRRHLSTPLYKGSNASRSVGPGAKHIIDFLTYTAKSVIDAVLEDLHQFMRRSPASTTDKDIVGYWNHFAKVYEQQKPEWFTALHQNLRSDLEACRGEWGRLVSPGVNGDYRASAAHVFKAWSDIKPRIPTHATGASDAACFLLQDGLVSPELSQWELLKASLAFKLYSRHGRFVWQTAGRQLQAIKALSISPGGAGGVPVVVVPNMYAALKPDNTYIKRLMASEEEGDGLCISDDPVPVRRRIS
ncbi:putative rna-dependent rna polymerase [Diaporthe ampelina]|uniref:RNA-dependent RNA polymerase n=1 Tax=Diaporthe ampelina TaxID=1214573 RepID=A0A0G2FHV3_9PEZI|nr:putative rna-dependent rna polymerase [Diaporthe ampelina]